jgi:serine/threonine protein phosphatase 1
MRLYAIGDVHGRLDLLEDMFRQIDADRTARPGARAVEILLGDLIDRGADSAGVVEAAIGRQASHGLTALRGNHDQYLLDALADPSTVAHWLNWGGREALQSWGLVMDDAAHADPDGLVATLRRSLPPRHLDFIKAMPLSIRHGDILFVHAGIRPGVPLDRQASSDMMLIREPFHSDARDHGVIVVHGHTPATAPVVRPNRIGVDTGAYNSGVLTCAVIEDDALRFLTAHGPEGHWSN